MCNPMEGVVSMDIACTVEECIFKWLLGRRTNVDDSIGTGPPCVGHQDLDDGTRRQLNGCRPLADVGLLGWPGWSSTL
ncbi:hypothetical protein CTA2_9167 [Colletotrichum tanaceti]|nr:hypothetical protein CTA2_9167 [Colletotrichum tanaceti]